MSDAGAQTRFLSGTQVQLTAGRSRLARHKHSFVATAGPNRGSTWNIEAPSVRIGTAPHCEVRLADDSVSRQHCEVAVRGGHYMLKDLGSTNGTRLHGVAILEAYLERQAVLRLGETEIQFDCESSWLQVDDSRQDRFGSLYGISPLMRRVFGVLERIADTNLTCLLLGDTGTGKDLAAQALHAASARKKRPFIVVDCGTLQPSLVESELFGHEQGAFTGAERARAGAFEEARGGTLFLDEVGELPPSLQTRLLRVLERREVKRVGANEPIPVDVRVVAATHRNLTSRVESGQFRQDLYYRLAEVAVRLPSLQDRVVDIPGLADILVQQGSGKDGRPTAMLSKDAVAYLQARPWPGNVRELRNVIRRAVMLASTNPITRATFEELERVGAGRSVATSSSNPTIELREHQPIRDARAYWLSSLEKQYLERTLQRLENDLDAIATHVGLSRKSVIRLLRQHGLETP